MKLKYSSLGQRQKESNIARLMATAIERRDLLSLAAGFTDTDTLPLEELTELALALGDAGDKRVFQYGTNQGDEALRSLIANRVADQDHRESFDAGDCFVTNGSQQALYLAAQTLCDPGDIVLVEQPSYFVFLEMLQGLGIRAVGMPMREDGEVDVPAVGALLDRFEASGEIDLVKAVYLVSFFANPTGHSISEGCKKEVLELLSRRGPGIALLEDAAYRELYFDEAFAAPGALALSKSFPKVPMLYSSTLTKPLAAGLKVGYGLCNDSDWLARMLAVKGQQDFGTAHYNQSLLKRALATDLLDRHLGALRQSYHAKMQALDRALESEMSGLGWKWRRPGGGLYIWMEAPIGVDTGFESAFHALALDAGVMYVPGSLCFASEEPRNFARLSFGVLSLEEVERAGKRFAEAARRLAEQV